MWHIFCACNQSRRGVANRGCRGIWIIEKWRSGFIVVIIVVAAAAVWCGERDCLRMPRGVLGRGGRGLIGVSACARVYVWFCWWWSPNNKPRGEVNQCDQRLLWWAGCEWQWGVGFFGQKREWWRGERKTSLPHHHHQQRCVQYIPPKTNNNHTLLQQTSPHCIGGVRWAVGRICCFTYSGDWRRVVVRSEEDSNRSALDPEQEERLRRINPSYCQPTKTRIVPHTIHISSGRGECKKDYAQPTT